MIWFVQYLKTHLNLAAADADFYRKSQAYIDLLGSLRKPVAKSNSKVACKTRYDRFLEGEMRLQECQAVLRKAKAAERQQSGMKEKILGERCVWLSANTRLRQCRSLCLP